MQVWFHPECVRITPAEYRKVAAGIQKTWKCERTRENYSGGESEEIVIQEINERLFRKRNVIIFNLKENLSKDTKTKIEHDTLLISKVIDALNISIHVNGLKSFRLGKPLKDKDRPLKVVFCSAEDAMQFFSGFSREAISDVDPALSDISISRDRTMKERHYLKKLRDELERRRMNG
ncbi:hypothetical protein J6590_080300 [Homalodisca vitripennis]|nr:hypothetical protein J6590_080300 [Homalodisca vitripennis]